MTAPHLRMAGFVPEASTPTAADHREIDHVAVQRAARELLRALGADVDADGLEETPRRVADAYAELLTPRPFQATTFPNDGYDQLIVARSIPFHSTEARREDGDLGAARPGPRRRPHTPGVPGPDDEDIP